MRARHPESVGEKNSRAKNRMASLRSNDLLNYSQQRSTTIIVSTQNRKI